MTTAIKLREIYNGRQAAYRLDPPVTLNVFGETKEVTYLVSAHSVFSRMMDDETMLFESDSNGNIISYMDLYYMPGNIDHDVAVQSFLKENTHE